MKFTTKRLERAVGRYMEIQKRHGGYFPVTKHKRICDEIIVAAGKEGKDVMVLPNRIKITTPTRTYILNTRGGKNANR